MKLRRTLLVSAATATLMTVGLASASAHVTVEPTSTEAGAYTVVTFAASHGCEGSPTTSFTISIPETIADAKPTVYSGWNVEKVEEELAEPLTTADGATITRHTGKIIYTAQEPLEDGYRVAFEVQVKNPETTGETLAFPVLQSCADGQTDWAEIPAADQDPHELEAPAPIYTLTAGAAEDEHSHGAEAVLEDEAQAPSTTDAGSTVPGYLGLVAGVLGLILGGFALSRTRRSGQ